MRNKKIAWLSPQRNVMVAYGPVNSKQPFNVYRKCVVGDMPCFVWRHEGQFNNFLKAKEFANELTKKECEG